MALVHRLPRRQDDFELDETTKVLDSIQVNSGSSNQEHLAPFCHSAPNGQNAAESLQKHSRVLASHPCVNRFLRALLVSALVRNQFARTVRKRADLEPSSRNHKEGICLVDDSPSDQRRALRRWLGWRLGLQSWP